MKLSYLAYIRIPTEKAHGIQIMKMCDAFARVGVDVDLVVPENEGPITDDAFDYYGMDKNFSISYLNHKRNTKSSLGFVLSEIRFFFKAKKYLKKSDMVFVRHKHLAFMLSFTKIPYVWEIHQDFWGWAARRAINKAKGTIFISNGLKDFYSEKMGRALENWSVYPDAVDEERFQFTKGKEHYRNVSGLPHDKFIVYYSGHLYPWKGVYTLADSGKMLPDDVQIVFAGGTDEDIKKFKDAYGSKENITILGRVPYKESPNYKQSADILAIPNTAKKKISSSFTSPMKLFSSLATGVPILASDLPSLREIINEKYAYFFEPDNPQDLARMIKTVKDSYQEASQKAHDAKEYAHNFTWTNRAKGIVDQYFTP